MLTKWYWSAGRLTGETMISIWFAWAGTVGVPFWEPATGVMTIPLTGFPELELLLKCHRDEVVRPTAGGGAGKAKMALDAERVARVPPSAWKRPKRSRKREQVGSRATGGG